MSKNIIYSSKSRQWSPKRFHVLVYSKTKMPLKKGLFQKPPEEEYWFVYAKHYNTRRSQLMGLHDIINSGITLFNDVKVIPYDMNKPKPDKKIYFGDTNIRFGHNFFK